MEIGRGLLITGVGMGVVFTALSAMWLSVALLGGLPRAQSSEPPVSKTPEEEDSPSPTSAGEEDVAAITASLLLAGQGAAVPSTTRRAITPWRAVVRAPEMLSRGKGT